MIEAILEGRQRASVHGESGGSEIRSSKATADVNGKTHATLATNVRFVAKVALFLKIPAGRCHCNLAPPCPMLNTQPYFLSPYGRYGVWLVL